MLIFADEGGDIIIYPVWQLPAITVWHYNTPIWNFQATLQSPYMDTVTAKTVSP